MDDSQIHRLMTQSGCGGTLTPAVRRFAQACAAAGVAAERERWRTALGACDAALALCQPCAEPDCRAVQREYIDEARAAAAALLRA
jgi:hypothetical protein